jgi:hypothetical protein
LVLSPEGWHILCRGRRPRSPARYTPALGTLRGPWVDRYLGPSGILVGRSSAFSYSAKRYSYSFSYSKTLESIQDDPLLEEAGTSIFGPFTNEIPILPFVYEYRFTEQQDRFTYPTQTGILIPPALEQRWGSKSRCGVPSTVSTDSRRHHAGTRKRSRRLKSRGLLQ